MSYITIIITPWGLKSQKTIWLRNTLLFINILMYYLYYYILSLLNWRRKYKLFFSLKWSFYIMKMFKIFSVFENITKFLHLSEDKMNINDIIRLKIIRKQPLWNLCTILNLCAFFFCLARKRSSLTRHHNFT